MTKHSIIFLSGSSGSGKSTVIRTLLKKDKNIHFIKSHTTREKRVDDQNNTNYYYISESEFKEKLDKNEMLEHDFFNNNYYGMSKKEINDLLAIDNSTLIKDATLIGIESTREKFGAKHNVIAVFFDVPKKVLIKRLKERGTTNYKNRLKVYKQEKKNQIYYDYILTNTNLDTTLETINTIINNLEINAPLLLGISTQKISNKAINIAISKISNNKKIRPIKIALKDGNLYIVDGYEYYLASIKLNKLVPRLIVETNNILVDTENNAEWLKLVKQYNN